jgi:hypothetical protein
MHALRRRVVKQVQAYPTIPPKTLEFQFLAALAGGIPLPSRQTALPKDIGAKPHPPGGRRERGPAP